MYNPNSARTRSNVMFTGKNVNVHVETRIHAGKIVQVHIETRMYEDKTVKSTNIIAIPHCVIDKCTYM